MMAGMESIGHITQGFTPAHADLPRSAGLPALLGSQSYVEALARVVYYWGYPGVETFARTNTWQIIRKMRARCSVSFPPGRRTTPAA